jgi:hypothetical protein
MSRNGTAKKNYSGQDLSSIIAPYGMRQIDGYGENVWELYNRDYDVIGLPFRFSKKPTLKQLQSVAENSDSLRDKTIYFYTSPFTGSAEYWKRINKVLSWKLADGPLEIKVEPQEPPHSYGKI